MFFSLQDGLLAVRCPGLAVQEADKLYWSEVMSSESGSRQNAPNGGADQSLYYAVMNGHMKHMAQDT